MPSRSSAFRHSSRGIIQGPSHHLQRPQGLWVVCIVAEGQLKVLKVLKTLSKALVTAFKVLCKVGSDNSTTRILLFQFQSLWNGKCYQSQTNKLNLAVVTFSDNIKWTTIHIWWEWFWLLLIEVECLSIFNVYLLPFFCCLCLSSTQFMQWCNHKFLLATLSIIKPG